MQIKIRLSQQARREYAVRTGKELPDSQQLLLNLEPFTPEERARFIDVFGLDGERFGYSPASEFRAPVFPDSPESWRAVLTKAETFLVDLTARLDREAAANTARQAARITAAEKIADDLEAASDPQLLTAHRQSYYLFDLPMDCPDSLVNRRQALIARAQSLIAAEEEAREAAKRAQAQAREAERRTWIEAHGSPFLLKATTAGYDCQRRYVLERAEVEHPGGVVDIENAAEWRSRSCPSEAALDFALEHDGEVIWLTEPARTSKPDPGMCDYDDCGERFESREAVVVRGWLGQYNVIYTSF